jgi:hypothetical protein
MRVPKVHVGFVEWGASSRHGVYEHVHIPHLLHVVCPTCGRRASARSAQWAGTAIGAFEVRCSHCMFRKGGYEREALKLFYRLQARGKELWAWNRQHLMDLLVCLQSRGIPRSSLPFSRNYVRREWLVHRHAFAKEIHRVLRAGA